MPVLDYLYRKYLWHFDTKVVLRSLQSRKGKCKRCGKCCTGIIFKKCIFLNKDNVCRIERFKPLLLCKIPPLNITKGERKKHEEVSCGFYWDDNKC